MRHAGTIRDSEAVLKWLVVKAHAGAAWQVVRHRRDEARLSTPSRTRSGRLRASSGPATRHPTPLCSCTSATGCCGAVSSQLPARCQQILRFVASADRPDYKAIAALTGMQVTAVGVTRGRCLARLRSLLDDDVTWEGA